MERLNSNVNSRRRSVPEGGIAAEELDVNAATLKELQAIKYAVKRGAPFRDAIGTLNQNDERLVSYAMERNACSRCFLNIHYLDRGGYSKGVFSAIGNLENKLRTHLGDTYGWDQQRTNWLLREMGEDLSNDFKETLAPTGDRTAQKVAQALSIWKLEEMKPIVDALLDSEAKTAAGRSFAPQYYEDSPLLLQDLGRFVEIIEMSLANNAATERVLATV